MTHQTDEVAGLFESVDGRRVGHIHNGDLIYFKDHVVYLQPAVDGRRAAWDDLRQADGWIVADMRVIRATGDAETETRVASLQNDFFVLPSRFISSVRL